MGGQFERGGHESPSIIPTGVRYVDSNGQPSQAISSDPSESGGLFNTSAAFVSDAVTVSDVLDNLKKNTDNAQKVIRAAVKRLPIERTCKCEHALKHAIMTDLKTVPEATRQKLELLLKKYL